MATTTVTIAGVTGKHARLVAKHLLSHPNVNVHGLCRSPSKIPAFLSENTRFKAFESSSTDTTIIREALKNASAAVCCYLGDDELMINGQKLLIEACIAEGVPRYIASDWSLDYRSLKYGDHPSKDPMKHIQEYLEQRQDKIKGVHILNGCFMETFWSFAGTWDSKDQTFRYWGDGNEKWDLTSYDDSAHFTAEAALDKDATGFLCCEFGIVMGCVPDTNGLVLGDRASTMEIAAMVKDTYGIDPKVERLGSLHDLFKEMTELRAKNPDNMWAWVGK